MQGASTIKLSLSTTLTLTINTLLPYVENKALKRVANQMNNINNYLLESEVDYQRDLESRLK